MNILILIGENKCSALLQAVPKAAYRNLLFRISVNCKFLVKWLKRIWNCRVKEELGRRAFLLSCGWLVGLVFRPLLCGLLADPTGAGQHEVSSWRGLEQVRMVKGDGVCSGPVEVMGSATWACTAGIGSVRVASTSGTLHKGFHLGWLVKTQRRAKARICGQRCDASKLS